MKNVLIKLNKIQTELKAPKGQFNAFGKYKYRSCEDILESVKPLLAKYECAITIGDTMILHGDRFYVEATVSLYDCESGEIITNRASAREAFEKKGMDESQITGTASSYARKYALNGLLAIDDTKDADATNTHGKEPQDDHTDEIEALRNSKIDKVQIATIQAEMLKKDVKEGAILGYYKIKSLSELTKEQFVTAMKTLDKK